jgi:heme/copper-type cytochrome/quinol oxidase subunit 2
LAVVSLRAEDSQALRKPRPCATCLAVASDANDSIVIISIIIFIIINIVVIVIVTVILFCRANAKVARPALDRKATHDSLT